MGDLIQIQVAGDIAPESEDAALLSVTNKLLLDDRLSVLNEKTMSVPIAELATLGAGVSSLIPALNTVTTTTTFATNGLFRIANQATGDVLKMAKNGNAWSAMTKATGGSKMVQLAEAGPITATSQAVEAINPATLMMAAALYSIERQLGKIAETQKQMLSFLEIKDEAGVEADLETLTELITNYKHNWDREVYIQSSHKMVMDIKRTARSNMLSYRHDNCNNNLFITLGFVARRVFSSRFSPAPGQRVPWGQWPEYHPESEHPDTDNLRCSADSSAYAGCYCRSVASSACCGYRSHSASPAAPSWWHLHRTV